MIDFVKMLIFNQKLIKCLNDNYLLEWVSETDKLEFLDNEVITTITIKQYKGIYFLFYPKRLDIYFKPHYYFNGGVHNGNDFSIVDCINVIQEFKELFQIDLLLLKVVNIEFGINVIPKICVKRLLSLMYSHGKNQFNNDVGLAYSIRSSKPKNNGTFNKFKIIKGYAKGIQQPKYCHNNTFRFEVKSKESKYINTFGIYTLNDLLNAETYFKLSDAINSEFKEVLILDNITNFKMLTKKEQEKIKDYNNPLKWNEILNNKYRNCFSDNKNIYNKLTNKVQNNIKNEVQNLIFEKLEEFKKGAISTSKRETKYVQFPQYIRVENARTKNFFLN